MSIQTAQQSKATVVELPQAADEPDKDKRDIENLRRLANEAGSYLGKLPGDTLPLREVRIQGEEHGYKDWEIQNLFQKAGISEADEVVVPERGALFGELWALEDDDGGPYPAQPTTTLTTFREWLTDREKAEQSHSYTRKKAQRRFARVKDVDRYFIKEYETFSTVLLSYCAGQPSDEDIARHSEKFYPRAVTRKRRNILKDMGAYDEYSGVSVLAPKLPTDREPYPAAPSGYTHAHDFLWVPGEVSPEDFYPVIKKHIKHVEGATPELHPLGEAVTVQVHHSEDVDTPTSVRERGSDLDRKRGVTTSLPQELGGNLPLLNARFDARGLPEYAERWCAHMRLGTDGETDTKGVRRFRPMKNGRHTSRFSEIADGMKHRRKLSNAVRCATALKKALGTAGYGTQAEAHMSKFTFTANPSEPSETDASKSRFNFSAD